MFTKIHLNKILTISLFLAASAFVANIAKADLASGSEGNQAPQPKIIFPIAELGNCTDRASCKAYCDQPGHMEACIAYAEKHNLLPRQDIENGRNFAKKLKTEGGPGGCKNSKECRNYCEDDSHQSECQAFAEKIQTQSTQKIQRERLKKSPEPSETPEIKSQGPDNEDASASESGDRGDRPPVPPQFRNGGGTNLPEPPKAPRPLHTDSIMGLIWKVLAW